MNCKHLRPCHLGWLLALFLASSPAIFSQDLQGHSAAAMGAAMLFYFVVFALIYIFVAFAVQTIAQKTNTPNSWFAWIPILNIILILNIAKKPLWWIVLLLIPIVNIVVAVIVWMAVAEVRQKPTWWGILTIIPLFNLIAIAYLAWAD